MRRKERKEEGRVLRAGVYEELNGRLENCKGMQRENGRKKSKI